jgi:Uma2 family endonuclease
MNLKYQFDYLSAQDYLEGELHSAIKHEYIDGQAYAMAGASSSHNRIVANLNREFGNYLRNTPCEPFASDMKVQVDDNFFYPDVLVACHHQGNDYGVTDSPLIIVEVLSKPTRKIDHTFKRLAYQRLASLQEYVIIEQDIADIEVCRRNNHWQSEHYFLGDDVWFESIDVRLPVSTIYERVENEDVLVYLRLQKETNTA